MMEGRFTSEPIVTNTQYIGFGIVNGLNKILIKEHQPLSIEEKVMYFV